MIKTFFTPRIERGNKKTIPNLVSGFTLVETMVAVLILTLTIVSLMTVVANSLFAARYARDEITASYLMQEVVDYIRNDRDTTVFLNSGANSTDILWTTFTNNYANCVAGSTFGCRIDVSTSVPGTPLISGDTSYLYYDSRSSADVFYTYNTTGTTKTGFKRSISVTTTPEEMDVTVTVSWKNGGLDKSESLKTTLTRWQR